MDDSWLRETMERDDVDGIFAQCVGSKIHTDFFAVRPRAVDYKVVDGCLVALNPKP